MYVLLTMTISVVTVATMRFERSKPTDHPEFSGPTKQS